MMRGVLRQKLVALSTVGFVLGFTPVTSFAGDFCALLNSFHLVGKGVSIPNKGACKVFGAISPDIPGWIGTGSICTSSDNTTVLFNVADQYNAASTDSLNGTFTKSTGLGSGNECGAPSGSSNFCGTFTVTVQKCSPSSVPIPAEIASPSAGSRALLTDR